MNVTSLFPSEAACASTSSSLAAWCIFISSTIGFSSCLVVKSLVMNQYLTVDYNITDPLPLASSFKRGQSIGSSIALRTILAPFPPAFNSEMQGKKPARLFHRFQGKFFRIGSGSFNALLSALRSAHRRFRPYPRQCHRYNTQKWQRQDLCLRRRSHPNRGFRSHG